MSVTARPLRGSSSTAISRPVELSGLQLLGRWTAMIAVGVLTAFHGHLLWQRITSLSLLDPAVAVRWVATLLLVAGFAHLQRSGISWFRGRKALVLWLLVLLLHTGMTPPVDGRLELVAEAGLLLALPLWGRALREVLGRSQLDGQPPRIAPLFPLLRDLWPPTPGEPELFASLSPRPPPAHAFL